MKKTIKRLDVSRKLGYINIFSDGSELNMLPGLKDLDKDRVLFLFESGTKAKARVGDVIFRAIHFNEGPESY